MDMFNYEVPTPENILDSAKCIILDIEGTTTSLEFVQKELIPYARQHLAEYVYKHWDDEMKGIIDLLIEEQPEHDVIADYDFLSTPTSVTVKEEFQAKVISHLQWQMQNDFKSTGLKTLQGYMWTIGYNEGLLQGHVYKDVPVALKQWNNCGKKIYIYSSGSIQAQKLLLRYSIEGDLDKFIDGNFDQHIGSKICSESYSKIADQINEEPKNIVFISDNIKELRAAYMAKMTVLMIDRNQVNPVLLMPEDAIWGIHCPFGTKFLLSLNSFLPIIAY